MDLGAFILWFAGFAGGSSNPVLDSASWLCDNAEDDSEITIYAQSSGLDAFVGNNVLQELLYDPDCNLDSACFEKYKWDIISTLLVAGIGILIETRCNN